MVDGKQFDVLTIERFYYCLLISILLFQRRHAGLFSNKSTELNRHVIKWLDSAIKNKLWDKSVMNEINWLKRNISANVKSTSTLTNIANIHHNLYQVNRIKQ